MSESLEEKICPRCRAVNPVVELSRREYRCGDCGLELAHFTTLSTGAIRDFVGWLLDIGTEVKDRYRVTAVLGKGGFGATYLVDDLLLHGKRRAMKEVPEILFDEYETRLLGRLHHPAIPDITDRFNADGRVYLVLEFGGDRTLRIEQERRGGRIPLFVLLPWILQLCEALQYLHEQDPPIAHRDLKPDNVLLDDGDRVMLIDFGIAKEAVKDTVTRTIGRAVSQGFSPPEQVLGTGTDARSDVYALGAIVYNLLTGRMPPAAHERISGAVIEPLSASLPAIPPLIDTAVMQALELNINLRQQTVIELARVLELVQVGSDSAPTVCVSDQPATDGKVALPSVQLPSTRSRRSAPTSISARVAEPAPTPPVRRSSRLPLGAGVMLMAVAAGAAWWFWLGKPESHPELAATDEVPDRAGSLAVPSEPNTAETDAGRMGLEAVAGAAPIPPMVEGPRAEPGPGVETASEESAGRFGAIFSDEQDAAGQRTQARRLDPVPSGSLMELFEKHRAEAAQEALADSPAPPAAEPTASPVAAPSESSPTPSPVVVRPPQVAKTTSSPPAPKPPPQSAGASDWGFEYKGATKKY